MRLRVLTALCICTGIVAAPALRAQTFFPVGDAQAVANGAAIYAEHCAACHGEALEGEPDWKTRKPSGRMPAPPHDRTGHTWHHAEQQLFLLTKYGVAALVGQGYESDMPGYEDILTDDQILEVLAYIKSTWPADLIERHDQISTDR